eukprot:5367482-Pyramimonas_sp.AAC.1
MGGGIDCGREEGCWKERREQRECDDDDDSRSLGLQASRFPASPHSRGGCPGLIIVIIIIMP